MQTKPSRFHMKNVLILLTALLLSACAGYSPNDRMLGSSREQVMQIIGESPTELMTPAGKVLIYPRGPFGKHTYFVYLNRDGVMESWAQVLDEKNFDRIKMGMRRDEVIATIGESKDTFGLARNRGYVWNYRYVNSFCFWFQIEFTSEDTVRSTGYSKPPECRFKGVR